MNVTRQDAWSSEEDTLLAETVLRHIRQGKTQLEAFKEVGMRVSRTPAACGFRWNASIRKQYQQAIDLAKKERKNASGDFVTELNRKHDAHPLETAISILEDMKGNYHFLSSQKANIEQLENLIEENDNLRKKIVQYEAIFLELERLAQLISELKE